MSSSLNYITAGYVNKVRSALITSPREIHAHVMNLVTSFFRDDRWVPGLKVYVNKDGEVLYHMMKSAEMDAPGALMAQRYQSFIKANNCVSLTLASPSTRFLPGTPRPDLPNFYRLSTYSGVEAPLTTCWHIKMKENGACIKHRGVAKEDFNSGHELVAAHWALLFPNCPVKPERSWMGAEYYCTEYLQPDGAAHDPDFEINLGYTKLDKTTCVCL